MSTSSGTRASHASTTAGWRLAAAVPEVQVTATGRPVALRHSERHEAGRALVDDRHRVDPLSGRQRERQRRVARARGGHRVAQAAAPKLVDEGLERRVGAVDRDAWVRQRWLLLIPSRLHAAWRRLAARARSSFPNAIRACSLDHREHTFERRLAEIAEAGEGAVLVRLLARRPAGAARRPARPGRYAGVVMLGASAGIEEPQPRSARADADERLAAWMEVDADRGHRERLGATASVRRPAETLVDEQRAGRLEPRGRVTSR